MQPSFSRGSGSPPGSQPQPIIATAPRFVVNSNIQIMGGYTLSKLTFQELAGINSEISIEQYLSVGTMGLNHSKQFGLVRPPTVTLKRGLDNTPALWYWHQMAVMGLPNARADYLSLDIYPAGASLDGEPLMSYMLEKAWCAKINVSSARAGEGVVTEDITIACNNIYYGDGGH